MMSLQVREPAGNNSGTPSQNGHPSICVSLVWNIRGHSLRKSSRLQLIITKPFHTYHSPSVLALDCPVLTKMPAREEVWAFMKAFTHCQFFLAGVRFSFRNATEGWPVTRQ